MGQASERIEQHIDVERARLGENLDRLERKMRRQKRAFQETGIWVAALVVGAIVAGLLLGRR